MPASFWLVAAKQLCQGIRLDYMRGMKATTADELWFQYS